MKKIIYVLMVVVAGLALQSCDGKGKSSNDTPKLLYNVTATAEGEVNFTWFNGGAEVNGFAQVFQCNDSTNTLKAEKNAIPLANALVSNDAEVSKSANFINSMLKVNSPTGNYKLTVKGYVKYGAMVFMIDEPYPKEAPDSIQ